MTTTDHPRPLSAALGAVVRGLLADAGLSAAETARQLGMAPVTMRRRLDGSRPFLLGEVYELARLLGCSAADLLELAGQQPDDGQ